MNLTIKAEGQNEHHKIEGIFKSIGQINEDGHP